MVLASNPSLLTPPIMPILAAEPSLYPENLLEDYVDESSERRWWAIYTKSRQEKSLARQLLGMEIPFYLPLVPKTNLIRGRRFTSQIPLFGSYMFLFANEEERIKALTTERIVQLLAAPASQEIAQDLRNVRTLIEAGAPLTLESRLAVGRRVRVKSGALMGLEGVIMSRRGEDRLLVGVQFLQQGASILIQDFQVESI
jgi:transcriptional antiterminator RfaH